MLRLSEGRRKACFHYAEREQLRQSQRRSKKQNNVLDLLTTLQLFKSLNVLLVTTFSCSGKRPKVER